MIQSRSLLALLLLIAALPLAAETLTLSLPLEQAWEGSSPETARLAEVLRAPDQDRSLRPQVTWWYLLPPGRAIDSARLDVTREDEEALLSAEPRLLPILDERGEEEPLWSEDFGLEVGKPQILHGQRFQALILTPLRAEDGRLLSLRGADLRLGLSEAAEPFMPARPQRPDFPVAERVLDLLGERLLNPGDLPMSERAVGGSGFPTEAPSLQGSTVDMVMVTVDSLLAPCETYARERTNVGVPTVVRTMEWIEQRYPYGSDRAEMLRSFAREAYEKWSIRYMMIVGDTDIVPTRYAYSLLFVNPTTTPTDLYFSCLDGNWNADLDSHWCEVGMNGDPGDDADLMPEIYVGRMPAGSYEECQILLNKAREAQACMSTAHQNKVLLLGEVLFPQDWEPGMEIFLDGAEYCESVAVHATGPEHDVIRYYENHEDWPGSQPLTKDLAYSTMNDGQGVVLHNGHGGRQTMSLGDASLDAGDVEFMDNGSETFMLYMVNCTAAAFDYNSLAESFLSTPGGGAYAVVGSTRDTFSNISVDFQNAFFYALYDDPTLRLADLYVGSLIPHVGQAVENNGYRWAYLTLALLGDPSSWLRYELPETPALDYPLNWETGDGPMVITVENSSSEPWENAVVTLSKVGEDYQYGLTDAAGQISFDPLPETGGSYTLRVDGRGMDPRSVHIPVDIQSGTGHLSIASLTVDDSSDGTVLGNGNGLLEAGETVRLMISLQNAGDTLAPEVEATLSCSHDSLAVVAALDSFGDIAASAVVAGQEGYLVQLGQVADDEIFEFSLAMSNGDLDEFFLESASYDLELYSADFDDDDGDGDLENGESAVFTLSLVNWGRAMVPELTVSMEPTLSSSIDVSTGPQYLGNVQGLAHDVGPLDFTISRESSDPTDVWLIFEDGLGRADTLTLNMDRPDPMAGGPEFEFTTDAHVIRLSWEPNEGASFYRVERSAVSSSGPFEIVNPDWMESATYEDRGLQAFTPYWYRIVPLSEFLLPGEPSVISEITTQPALKEGWPQRVAWETPSTPVVTDINTDGELEIFVGSDLLYGFNPDGTELGDGDNDPDTHGPISTAGEKYFASLAAGDLYRTGVPSVVGAAWNTTEVVVWNLQDQGGEVTAEVAAGWPRQVISTSGIWATPVMADVTGDGNLEIFVVDLHSNLYGWHGDGTEIIDGDNEPLTNGVFATGLGNWTRMTPAFADVNRDGVQEIFVLCASGELRGYYGDGTPVPGFPFEFEGTSYSSLATGDIDADGWPELVFQTTGDSTYVINHNGSRRQGWPIHLDYNNYNYWLAPTPALANVAGDEHLEIFVTSMINGDAIEVGWLDYEGNWLSGWPVELGEPMQSSPVVGDIDGDGDYEVLLADENGEIGCWHHDGTPAAGFPIIISDAARACPTLTDVDGDGYLDMLYVGWDKYVYLWDFGTEYDPDALPWYTWQHDQLRSGSAKGGDWIIGEEVAVGDELPPGMVSLDANWPNPFNPSTRMQFTLGGGEAQRVRLSVHDVQGRRLAQLVDESLPPGTYLRSWDGRDDAGRSLPSGIYFARLQVDGRVETRKMTMLK